MTKIAIDLRGLRKSNSSLAIRYASGLGSQLVALDHEVVFVYRHPFQIDLVASVAKSASTLRLNTGLALVNNRVLNRLGVKLLYCPTSRVSRLGARFKVISTVLHAFSESATGGRLRQVSADRVIVGSVADAKLLVESRFVTAQPTTIYPSSNAESSGLNTQNRAPGKVLIYGGKWLFDNRVTYLAETLEVLGDFELLVTPKLNDSETRRLTKLFESRNAKISFAQLDSNKGLPALLAKGFALIQTELPDRQGLVPADAMALGIPLVLTDQPLMHEIAGATGIFFDPKDSLSLAGKIRGLQRQGAWVRAVEAGHKKHSQHTWTIAGQKLERLIQQLLA